VDINRVSSGVSLIPRALFSSSPLAGEEFEALILGKEILLFREPSFPPPPWRGRNEVGGVFKNYP